MFNLSGGAGPAIWMTDDSKAEHLVLSRVFPESHKLLCLFHVLQAVRRCTGNINNVASQNSETCYDLFVTFIYSPKSAG